MIHKMIASDEDTVRKDSSNSDTGNINQRFKKCVRKGDIVCFTNEENIHMANKPNKYAPTKAALDQPKSFERMSSGESLYKTFTFAQSANEEDTEKCIAFWKSVMEKNLQPVKCSIIENKEYQPKDDVEDGPSKCEKQSDSKTKIEETKQEVNIEEQIDEKLKLVHKEYRNMWDKAIKQIQKQKLDKIKLLRKSRCKMCDVLNTRLDEDVCGDEATIDKEIKDLNKWKSTAKKKAYATGSSRGSRNQQEKPKQMSTKLKNANEIRPTGAKAAEDTEGQDILEDKPKKIKPPPDTNTYEFVDAIANKLQSGTYSEWRSNALKETCTCGYRICCCNTNPAVKGILSSSCLPFQPIPVVNIDKTTKKTDTRASLIDKKELEKLPARSSLSRKSDELSNHKNAVKKALSLLIQCECSTESCDCEEEYQPLSRSKLPAEHWEIPPPPELHLPAQKRSSIEIYKERLSSSEMNLAKSISDHASRFKEDEGSKYKSDNSEGGLADYGSNTTPSVDNNGQEICAKTVEEGESQMSVKKTVSLASQDCGCSTESCDCFVAKEVNRDNLTTEVYTTADKVPDAILTEGKDTLVMEDKHSSNENQVINASSKEETTEAMHPQSESADPTDFDELDNLQLQVSTIVVKKDSIELTHEKSEHSWTKRHSLANYVELKRDNQCYENLGGKSEDRCGKRGHKHHSISMNPTRSNMNKLFKKISFSAKTCRCTNSRCDCYNVVQPGIPGPSGENANKQEDKPNGTESDLESEVYADSWKERSLGCDSEKDSMNVIMAIHGTDKKMADDSSSAASQFLSFNGP